jgi:hypothetical protein
MKAWRQPRRWLPAALVICCGLPTSALVLAAAVTNAPIYSALTDLTRPAQGLPFSEVILATTGHRVLRLETNNPAHRDLLRRLQQAAASAAERAHQQGLAAPRANEAGNHIEPLVREALNRAGLTARLPVNASGRAQAAGYPDIEITAPLPCYLELKTYSAATADTTQRSFYYSPSTAPKVTRDALHLLLAFEMEKVSRAGQPVFVPAHWRLLTLENLEVDLKFEFNQSNRGLYGRPQSVLGEGNLPKPAQK